MKNTIKKIFIFINIITLLLMQVSFAYAENMTDFNVNQESESILNAVIKSKNCNGIQDFIDNELTKSAGQGAEWYILGIYQLYNNKYNYEKFKIKLDEYVEKNKDKKRLNATSKQRIALTYLCIDEDNKYLENIVDETIGELGLFSYIYGLHLMNNGLKSSKWTEDKIIDKIIESYDEKIGFKFSPDGFDPDVTAMSCQALAKHIYRRDDVRLIVNNCLELLSKHQLDDAGFKSMDNENSESVSQMLILASMLNIDLDNDSRFIKNGKTFFDNMKMFRLDNGLYSHINDNNKNTLATQQAFYAFVSIKLNNEKKGNLYTIRKLTR